MRRQWLALTVALVLVIPGPASAASPAPADLVAAVRAARGDDLPTKEALSDIADRRVVEISRDFDHDGAGAPWPWGEIIAWNTYPDDLAVAEAIRGWLDSPPHRDVLLGHWTHFGVGVLTRDDGRHFFVVLFARITGIPPADPRPELVPAVTLPPTDTD